MTIPNDFHNVTLAVEHVRPGQTARNPHQAIKAVVNLKLSPKQAIAMVKLLQAYLDKHVDGMDLIRITLEGEFK